MTLLHRAERSHLAEPGLPQAAQACHAGLQIIVLLDQIRLELLHVPHQRAIVRSDETEVSVARKEVGKRAGPQHDACGVQCAPFVDVPEAAVENSGAGLEPLACMQEISGGIFNFFAYCAHLKVDLGECGPRDTDQPLDIRKLDTSVSDPAIKVVQLLPQTTAFLAHLPEPALAVEDLPPNLDHLTVHQTGRERQHHDGHRQTNRPEENSHHYTSRRCFRTAYPLENTPNRTPIETPVAAHAHGIHEMSKM